jgi:sulfite exporter TauE/SafE
MTIPFLIGLLSAVHCFGMCGGIVGALTMSLTPEIRARNSQLFYYSLAYNLGHSCVSLQH